MLYFRDNGKEDLAAAKTIPSTFGHGISEDERKNIRAICWDMNLLPRHLNPRTGVEEVKIRELWKDVHTIYVAMESEAWPVDPSKSCEMLELQECHHGRFEDLLSGRAAARRQRTCVNPGSFVLSRRMEEIRGELREYFWPGGRVEREVRFVVVANEGCGPVYWRLVE